MKTASALLVVLVALLAPGAVPGEGATLQGFVSVRLLGKWCNSGDPLDNEACLSYLRGGFDVLQVARDTEHRALIENDDGSNTICISVLAPITQLKIALQRYLKQRAELSASEAAGVLLMRMFRENYPC